MGMKNTKPIWWQQNKKENDEKVEKKERSKGINIENSKYMEVIINDLRMKKEWAKKRKVKHRTRK